MSTLKALLISVIALSGIVYAPSALAATIQATPSTLFTAVQQAQAGDTIELAGGRYNIIGTMNTPAGLAPTGSLIIDKPLSLVGSVGAQVEIVCDGRFGTTGCIHIENVSGGTVSIEDISMFRFQSVSNYTGLTGECTEDNRFALIKIVNAPLIIQNLDMDVSHTHLLCPDGRMLQAGILAYTNSRVKVTNSDIFGAMSLIGMEALNVQVADTSLYSSMNSTAIYMNNTAEVKLTKLYINGGRAQGAGYGIVVRNDNETPSTVYVADNDLDRTNIHVNNYNTSSQTVARVLRNHVTSGNIYISGLIQYVVVNNIVDQDDSLAPWPFAYNGGIEIHATNNTQTPSFVAYNTISHANSRSIRTTDSNSVVVNNVAVTDATYKMFDIEAGRVGNNVAWYTDVATISYGLGVHATDLGYNQTVDPQFTNALLQDYTTPTNSVLRNNARFVAADEDTDRNARPSKIRQKDIGAIEY